MNGLDNIIQLLGAARPHTWVFAGDSITLGALHTFGWRAYPELFAERVRFELRRSRDVVINSGVDGNRTRNLLEDIDWRILRFKPTVVSLMYGINDCCVGESGRTAFLDNLTAIVDAVMAIGAIPLLNTPNTIHQKNSDGLRGDLPAYAAIVREIAQQRQLALVDHYEHWCETKADPDELLVWLADKSIHPNAFGHREIARLIFRTLRIFDDNSLTCRLEVP